MPEKEFNPATTAAVVLGASRFESPDFQDSDAFRNSADRIIQYLVAELNLAPSRCLNLFNDDRSAPDQLKKIAIHFSEIDKRLKSRKRRLSDVFVYFIGHGAFEGSQNDYFLSIQQTNEITPGQSSIRIYSLAKAIKRGASQARKYIFLDCCFAGAASRQFMGDQVHVAFQKSKDAFPRSGTALVCASSARDPAMVPDGGSMTMFTEGLLDFLSRGYREGGKLLSLDDLALCLPEVMREKFGEDYVRPELHLPDQRHGNLSRIGLFPNKAKKQKERAKAEPISKPLQRSGQRAVERKERASTPGDHRAAPAERRSKRVDSRKGGSEPANDGYLIDEGITSLRLEEVWADLPERVKELVEEYRRERRLGWSLIGVILVASIIMGAFAADRNSGSSVLFLIYLVNAPMAAACIGFAIAARFRSERPAHLRAMGPRPKSWERIKIMRKLRRRKSILLFGRYTLSKWHLWSMVLLGLGGPLVVLIILGIFGFN